MDTEIFETTGDLSGGKVAQMMSEIFVSQSIDRILSADDDLTELLVIHGEEVESFVGSSMELFGFRDLMKEFPACWGIINLRDKGKIAFISGDQQ